METEQQIRDMADKALGVFLNHYSTDVFYPKKEITKLREESYDNYSFTIGYDQLTISDNSNDHMYTFVVDNYGTRKTIELYDWSTDLWE